MLLKPNLQSVNPLPFFLRPSLTSTSPPITTPSIPTLRKTTYTCLQVRHARLLKRPKRPYTFTQLLTLSDGTAYTIRTTSPLPVYRSTRDTRNAPLWNPSIRELLNVEADEAGRLASFRSKFGRGWDASKEVTVEGRSAEEKKKLDRVEGEGQKQIAKQMAAELQEQGPEEEDFGVEAEEESLLDLISSYGQEGGAGQAQTGQAKGKKR